MFSFDVLNFLVYVMILISVMFLEANADWVCLRGERKTGVAPAQRHKRRPHGGCEEWAAWGRHKQNRFSVP